MHAELDVSSFTTIPHGNFYGNKDKTVSKSRLRDANHLAYLQTCTEEGFFKGNIMFMLSLLIVKKIKKVLRYVLKSQI